MFSLRTFNKILSLVLLFSLVLTTMPVSASDLGSTKPLGSVSGAGPVQLRGMSITHEGTIFTGDQLSVGSKGYAKVMLVQGQKLEMDQMTDMTITQQGTAVQLRLKSGNVSFSTSPSGSLQIIAGNYQITSDKPMSGNIALIGGNYVGIHMDSGAATMQNIFTKQAIRIPGGEARMLGMAQDPGKAPVAQVASLDSLPLPVPSVPPVPMPPQASSGSSSGKLGTIVILGTIAGAIAAITLLANSSNNNSGNTAAQALAIANAQTAINGAAVAAASASTSVSTANSAIVAINASTSGNKTTLSATAQNLLAQANASQAAILGIQAQLASLQQQLSGATDTSAIDAINSQIASVTSNLNGDITTLNNLINQLNASLVTDASQGVNSGLPPSITSQPPQITLASATNP